MRLRRLSVPLLAFALTTGPTISRAAADPAPDPELLELQHYTLTMDKVNRLFDTMQELQALEKSHPELKDKLAKESENSGNESLAQAERRIASQPVLVGALARHGYTPHEFIVCEMTFFQAAFAEATAQQSGVDKAKMASDAHVNPANMTFIEQHKAELEALESKGKPASKTTPEPSGTEADN